MAVKERVFSGMQPTGALHLGNYLGAMVQWIKMQETHDCIYCVVDLHAITQGREVWGGPEELQASIRTVAAAYLACGLDPKKSIIFNQSQVAAHGELAWIFNCVARLGWLNRMTQFKEKAGKDRENASVGLFAYPNLMAADILAYRATHVPVGDDQKQHLELTRDIAQKFNNDFGDRIADLGLAEADGGYFPLPEPVITGPGDPCDEPAGRLAKDVEVRAERDVPHQPDGRRGRDRAEGSQGQDRSRAIAVRGRWAGRTRGSGKSRWDLRGVGGRRPR
jgi:tryptophanyl-tRNA synthetase